MQCPSKTKNQSSTVYFANLRRITFSLRRILYFLAIDNERKNTNTIDCPKKNVTKMQERRKFPSFCHRAGRIRKLQKNAGCTFPKKRQLFTGYPPKKQGTWPVRSQTRPRVVKVYRLRNEEANQFVIADHSENEERYNDARWCRCYEVTLLMKKNEIRTDRKYPLTTPEHTSVLQNTKAFFFFHERNLYSSCSRIYSSIVKTWHSYQEYT